MKNMLQYVGWFAVFSLFSMLAGTAESFVIRHRLSSIDSAGYYMISRFSDIVIGLGVTCASILFPIIAENHERKIYGQKNLLFQSFLLQLIGGGLFAIFMALCAYALFQYKADWNVYTIYVPHLILLCAIGVMRSITYCFVMHELAMSRFKFVIPFSVFYILEVGLLYGGTGYSFFVPWLPGDWIRAIEVYNPCRLSFVLTIMFASAATLFIYVLREIFSKSKAGEARMVSIS